MKKSAALLKSESLKHGKFRDLMKQFIYLMTFTNAGSDFTF